MQHIRRMSPRRTQDHAPRLAARHRGHLNANPHRTPHNTDRGPARVSPSAHKQRPHHQRARDRQVSRHELFHARLLPQLHAIVLRLVHTAVQEGPSQKEEEIREKLEFERGHQERRRKNGHKRRRWCQRERQSEQ